MGCYVKNRLKRGNNKAERTVKALLKSYKLEMSVALTVVVGGWGMVLSGQILDSILTIEQIVLAERSHEKDRKKSKMPIRYPSGNMQ